MELRAGGNKAYRVAVQADLSRSTFFLKKKSGDKGTYLQQH